MQKKRDLPRLPASEYLGRRAVAFTACTEKRIKGLDDPEAHERFRGILREEAARCLCVAPAYVLMPDHLHAILLGTEKGSRPKDAFDRFRLRSGIWLATYRPDLRWQKGAYDHVLRNGESLDDQVRYLLLNPARAGLAQDVDDWPYQGSLGVDRDEAIVDAFWGW